MIKTKMLGFFVALVSFAAPLLAIVNPDPNYIKITDSNKIKLSPHGFDNVTPSRDTLNFQWIFNNYPHSDIELSEGTYHISECVEAANYQGTIKGKGQKKTHIVGRGPLVDGQYVFPYLNDDLKERMYPTSTPWLFWFHAVDGDVNDWESTKLDLKIKDLSFRLDGLGALVTLFEQPLYALWGFLFITGQDASYHGQLGNVSHVEVDCKNVTFESQYVSYTLNGETKTHSNVASGFLLIGGESWVPNGIQLFHMDEIDHYPVNGQIKITDCIFKNQFQYGFGVEGLFTGDTGMTYTWPTTNPFPKSTLTVKNNVFDNSGNGANIIGGEGFSMLMLGISDADVVIKDNDFRNIPSVGLVAISGSVESMPKQISKIEINNNKFHQSATPVAAFSIFLFDTMFYSTGYSLLDIHHNTFTSDAGYNKAFINMAMGTSGVIKQNTFSGDAEGAISIGNFQSPYPPYQTLPAALFNASKNDFCGLNSSVANIILGPVSVQNTVTVEDASDVVNNGQYNTVIVK